MSGRQSSNTSTKIPVDINADSGYLSGPLSEQLLSEEFPHIDSDSSTQITSVESTNLDSGVDLSLSEQFSNVKLSESGRNNFDDNSTPTAQPQPTLNIIKDQDDRPLRFLFQQDDDGDTQLHIAAVHGCEKSVGTLVRVCPDQEWYNIPNDYGQTALHLAALSGHAVVTRMLVLAGASINIRDLGGETPLHLAATAGHNECLQALLAPIANEPHRRLSATLNQKNYNVSRSVSTRRVTSRDNLALHSSRRYSYVVMYTSESTSSRNPCARGSDRGSRHEQCTSVLAAAAGYPHVKVSSDGRPPARAPLAPPTSLCNHSEFPWPAAAAAVRLSLDRRLNSKIPHRAGNHLFLPLYILGKRVPSARRLVPHVNACTEKAPTFSNKNPEMVNEISFSIFGSSAAAAARELRPRRRARWENPTTRLAPFVPRSKQIPFTSYLYSR
ncbi:NF-kappa-B inhibitor cactus [Eumeta japonica]|uniref:NF-kappa-B inhibitor cactus n=1 Tax=Eumeta variegata TaxID=151549 RepID=A0A4C1XDP4_EUMVA|nr:NF-kappa-B inhibitor cactus [Eumeta japonica]